MATQETREKTADLNKSAMILLIGLELTYNLGTHSLCLRAGE